MSSLLPLPEPLHRFVPAHHRQRVIQAGWRATRALAAGVGYPQVRAAWEREVGQALATAALEARRGKA